MSGETVKVILAGGTMKVEDPAPEYPPLGTYGDEEFEWGLVHKQVEEITAEFEEPLD